MILFMAIGDHQKKFKLYKFEKVHKFYVPTFPVFIGPVTYFDLPNENESIKGDNLKHFKV